MDAVEASLRRLQIDYIDLYQIPEAQHMDTVAVSRHFMTVSALANTFGGMVRPICFAAFRLMMNSNFFGCSTGRSAGLAPFRILSTYVAVRRSKSVTLTP